MPSLLKSLLSPGALLRGQMQLKNNYTDDELTSIFNTLFDCVEFTIDLIKTKKPDLSKLINIYMGYGSPGNFVKIAKKAYEQFKRLTPQQAEVILVKVKQEFDIIDDNLEKKIEDSLDLVVDGFDLGIRNIQFIRKVSTFLGKDKDQEGSTALRNVDVAHG